MSTIYEIDNTYVASTYKRFPVCIVSGKGSEVFDENGKRYIDLGSGIAVTSFGIADEAWQQAVIEQIGRFSTPPTCIIQSRAQSWRSFSARRAV